MVGSMIVCAVLKHFGIVPNLKQVLDKNIRETIAFLGIFSTVQGISHLYQELFFGLMLSISCVTSIDSLSSKDASV